MTTYTQPTTQPKQTINPIQYVLYNGITRILKPGENRVEVMKELRECYG